MILRTITLFDTDQVLDIYKPFIIDSFVTFESEVPSVEEFGNRISQYTAKYPWLIAEDNGKIAGYAYASTYRERKAYQWMVECSVYIHPDYKRKNLGKKLYKALFEILKLQGIYKVFAVIALPNPQSVGFHENIGFQWFATYKNVGFKAGKWCDVGWWELILQEPEANPISTTTFSELNKEEITKILANNFI